MNIVDNEQYREDIKRVAGLSLPWEKLCGKGVLIFGASGLLGSFLVDVLMRKNDRDGLGCKVCAAARSEERARERFAYCWHDEHFAFCARDVSQSMPWEGMGDVQVILHLASNTHPVAYATDPIGTITTNILGTCHLLELAAACHAERFLLASSCEIYGENRGDVEKFDESYCGYIDANTMRAGYPESKRCSEALCQAYRAQKGVDVVIARLTRSYGPTMRMSDTKAISQFIRKAAAGEDIVLKSDGTQYYSYTYVSDAVAGLLTVLLCGESGEAYNIADDASDITLKDLAALIAGAAGRKVVLELPDAVESAGYTKATKSRLDGAKLQALGWSAHYDIGGGIRQTMEILRAMA